MRKSTSLENPLLGVSLALLAMLLCAPSLRIGWIFDDHSHRASLTMMGRSPADLFDFVDEETLRSNLPWWASDELRLAFFRPLSGFTHWLDYRLWPEEPMWMHLQSLFWLGLVVVAATSLYHRVAAPGEMWIGGLAALFFALDDAHGTPAVWIANRNALLAMFFGLLTLIAHHRRRRDGWRLGAFAAPTFLLLAVLSAEAGVACGAYLVSYALFLDRGPMKQRLTALTPCAAVGAAWYLTYRALGYGASASEFYVDPGAHPLRFLAAVVERGPILLWGQLSFPPADAYNFLSQPVARLAWLVVVVLLVLFGLLLVPLLRRDPRARFWTLGMLLTLLPSCVPLPNQRLLFYAGLGGAGLVAIFVADAWRRRDDTVPRPGRAQSGAGVWRRTARLLTVPLLVIHLGLAPAGLLTAAGTWSGLDGYITKAAATLPSDPGVRRQYAVIVNTPSVFFTRFSLLYRAMHGPAMARGTLELVSGLYPIEIHRPNARSLAVRPHGGFLAPAGSAPPGQEPQPFRFFYGFQSFDTLYHDGEPFQVGERIERRRVSIEITAVTDDGRPAVVTFHFDADLEDASWRWLRWENGGFAAWQPPAVGETVTLPAPRQEFFAEL